MTDTPQVQIQPAGSNLLVRVDPPEEKTKGGIYVPTKKSDRPNRGKVVAAGPDADEAMVGRRVVIMPFGSADLDDDLVFVPEEDVLGWEC